MSLWQSFVLVLEIFFLLAYLLVLFQVVGDLVRDRALSGVAKALWVVFLVLVPLIAALVYLIARGTGMAERSADGIRRHREHTDAYIREVAGTSPAQEIAAARGLLADGAITPEQFEVIKARALV
ncbi:PLDc N-terminal domain-containing protein [Cellulomonas sp. Marseille-Q8402]